MTTIKISSVKLTIARIHSGDSTQSHDHSITPVSLSTMNIRVSADTNPIVLVVFITQSPVQATPGQHLMQ